MTTINTGEKIQYTYYLYKNRSLYRVHPEPNTGKYRQCAQWEKNIGWFESSVSWTKHDSSLSKLLSEEEALLIML